MLRPLPRTRHSSFIRAAMIALCALIAVPAHSDTDKNELRATVTRLEADNAELTKLLEYAETLRDLADEDPASAHAARAPMTRCLATPLRNYCALLPGLFQQESAP